MKRIFYTRKNITTWSQCPGGGRELAGYDLGRLFKWRLLIQELSYLDSAFGADNKTFRRKINLYGGGDGGDASLRVHQRGCHCLVHALSLRND